jgi:thiol-disulfide isomerase/thioredoxin
VDLFTFHGDENEYLRAKRKAKDDDPSPTAWHPADADWTRAKEVRRGPCFKDGDRPCVVLEAPISPSTRANIKGATKVADGLERAMLDLDTGLAVSMLVVQTIEPASGSAYQSEATWTLKRMSYGAPPDPALFRLAEGMTEVKELARWDAPKIRRQLAGKPAPELNVTDISGRALSLDDFKGKTVLLDFWTTWCPPCRADAPALDKLYAKYGGNLAIVGVSVSEDRPVVEKFLKEHPHVFPVVLTNENEMPRPYQIGVFPTYIVIDRDGSLDSAAQGDQGFGELRKMLKKAGLEVD